MTAPAYLVDGIKLAVAIDLCGLACAAPALLAWALCRAGAADDARSTEEAAERDAEHAEGNSGTIIAAETGNGGETSAQREQAA